MKRAMKSHTSNGNCTFKKTTKGWDLLIEWTDGTSTWVPLKEVKAGNPVELAEYAVQADIANEPAFRWWVKSTLKKRNAIIAKVKSRYWKTTHKFGIELPKSVAEAYRIDEATNTMFCRDAIRKEMQNIRCAFSKQDDITVEAARSGQKLPGYQEIGCHMIFDIRLDGLIRKARLVAGGHTTETPASVTYSSVVSRDSVRIAFFIAALNELDVLAVDIGNAYLNAPCRE